MKDVFYENKLSVLPPSSGLHREKTSKTAIVFRTLSKVSDAAFLRK